MTYYLYNARKDQISEWEDEEAARDERQQLIGLGVDPSDVELTPEHPHDDPTIDTGDQEATDGGETAVVESEPQDDPQDSESESDWTPGDEGTPAAPAAQPTPTEDDAPTLQEDPIAYLENINSDFTNTVKGTPAISKRGFRYIQAELNISTESEVAGYAEDPYGVIVWAKAELPDGRSAEAHGEGYPSESGMDKGEWVRYADTRAKNRALSDLTSAGALAVDELKGGIDE
jgi:hypothetical protein